MLTISSDITTDTGAGNVQVWEIATGKEVTPPIEHSRAIYHASFSPDGRHILTASMDGTARIWDATTGKPTTPSMKHKKAVLYASFSHDGHFVITASLDKTARIWDAVTGEAITPPLQHNGPVLHASFSPDGHRVVTGSRDNTARLWNIPCDSHLVSDIVLLSQLVAGRRIDTAGDFKPLTTNECRHTWHTLQTKYPDKLFKSEQEVSGRYWQYLEDCQLVYKCIKEGKLKEASRLLENLRSLSHRKNTEFTALIKSMIYSLSREYYYRGRSVVSYADTIADYEAAIRIDPEYTLAYCELAWLRAVCPAVEFRDSAKAVEVATKACKLTNWQDHKYVSALAAVYSEAGDFDAATKWQKEAIDLLCEDERDKWQFNYISRLKLYQSTKPYHEGGLRNFSTGELVAWWKLDQSQDGEVPDSSGYGFNGKLMGDASIVADAERDKVLSLDGKGDYVAIDYSTSLDITSSITVAVWIKVKEFDKRWQAIITKGDRAWRLQRDSKNDGIEFACTGINVKGTTSGHVLGKVRVNDSQWHHVTGVYNGNEICIYVDGIRDVFAKGSGNINTNRFPVLIGENAGTQGRYWNGLIDDVRIYSYALSEEEVKELYTSCKKHKVSVSKKDQVIDHLKKKQ